MADKISHQEQMDFIENKAIEKGVPNHTIFAPNSASLMANFHTNSGATNEF